MRSESIFENLEFNEIFNSEPLIKIKIKIDQYKATANQIIVKIIF